MTSAVSFTKVGGALGTAQAALVSAPMTSTMSHTEAALFCILLTALVGATMAPTVSFTEATKKYVLLAALCVFARTTHHGKTHKIIILSVSLSLPL